MKTTSFIIGTDEVGRGCVAGPILAGSFSINSTRLLTLKERLQNLTVTNKNEVARKEHVFSLLEHDIKILPSREISKPDKNVSLLSDKELEKLLYIRDSKKTTFSQREKLIPVLINVGEWGIGHINSKEIDRNGISWANNQALNKSINIFIKDKSNQKKLILSDHFKIHKNLGSSQNIPITKGDSKSFVIACASIIAKQYRDYIMHKYSEKFPEYSFNKHVGYGTKLHLDAISKFGLTDIHRKSFLKKYAR